MSTQNTTTNATAATQAEKVTHSRRVVTWQSPRGNTFSVCTCCERAGRSMPRDYDGQEFCTVSHGLHSGHCDFAD